MKEFSKKPYVLYVGNNYPHKNLKRLTLAFKKINLDYELILITDFTTDRELDKLYKNASLFVFPSLYEGFGLPPLEAMKRGVPVISSNSACLPEILNDAVVYFNPIDVNDIAEKIKKVLLDKELRKKLTQKGFEQVKKYSWNKMVRQTLEVYKELF